MNILPIATTAVTPPQFLSQIDPCLVLGYLPPILQVPAALLVVGLSVIGVSTVTIARREIAWSIWRGLTRFLNCKRQIGFRPPSHS
jgi:hypothetical protein